MCSVVPMTSNEISMPAIDENFPRGRVTIWGRTRLLETAEGYEPAKTRPKIAQLKFEANTLIAECWSVSELVSDAPTLGANLTRVFSGEIAFKLDDAILNGSGAGMCRKAF